MFPRTRARIYARALAGVKFARRPAALAFRRALPYKGLPGSNTRIHRREEVTSMQWLENEVAVVTGAGSGIGRAVVARFIQEGAKVVAFDRSGERLAALKEEMGDPVAVVSGDVRSLEDNRRAVSAAVSAFGRLSVFVGNAGIHDARRPLAELSDEELERGYDEVFGVNVKGCLLGAKAAIRELMKSRGNMVFTLSTSSYYVSGGTLYVASKHAALGMVRQLANELAPTVRVNGVAPSGTVTGLRAAPSLAPGAGGDDVFGAPRPAAGMSGNLLQVTVVPEDHAAAYVLLASSQSRIMTGEVIHTDAGRGVTSVLAPARKA